MADDEDRPQIPAGTERVIFAGGIAIGGYFIAKELLSGNREERLRIIETQIEETQEDIASEVSDSGDIGNDELNSHIANYKALAKSLNNGLPSEVRIDLNQLENELQGEPLDVRALQWKTVTLQLLYTEYERVGGQSQLASLLSEAPSWVRTLLSISFITVTTAATITIIKRLLDFGRGGGGLGQLKDFADWVRNGIFGSQDVLDDIEETPDPDESPQTDIDPSPEPGGEPTVTITGSPRGAFHDTGISAGIAAEILAILGITATIPITVGERTIEAIASVTDKDKDFYINNPAILIVLVLVIAAAAVLSVGSGGTASPAAAAILLIVAGAVGVTFVNLDDTIPIGNDIRDRNPEIA